MTTLVNPVTLAKGEYIGWSYPTSVSLIPTTPTEANGTASGSAPGKVPGTGSATMTFSRPTGNINWGVIFANFKLPPLPSDAIIKNVYVCLAASHTCNPPGGGSAVVFLDSSPGGTWDWSQGYAFTMQQVNAVIGGDRSAVTGAAIKVGLAATLSQDGLTDVLTIGALAIAVHFSSAIYNLVTIGHGVNCNAYDNGGFLNPLWAPGNGELIEDIEPLRNWCRANGISVAVKMDSQRSAKDLFDELFLVGNSAPVYSGSKLKVIPYDEVSAAGNGRIYIAPTAAGPQFDLTDQDFVFDGKNPPVVPLRKSRTDCDNAVAIEFVDRTIDYARNVASDVDPRGVSLYGPRKGGSLDSAAIGQRPSSGAQSVLSLSSKENAFAIASVLSKRSAAGVNGFAFTLKAEHFNKEAMDFGTISDKRLGLNKLPVRLTQVRETEKRTYECECEVFIYGLNHPKNTNPIGATGSLVTGGVDPGLVNTPIIFEPTSAMLAGTQAQVWVLVSGADANYGGCVAYVSVDGGSSYDVLGTISPATTGVLTADYPSHPDPDTADTLSIDLTESNGSFTSQSQQIADGFADPCYVAGTSGWEIVCPTAATMTALSKYDLATYIRRAVQGTTAMDHPTGSRFAVVAAAMKVDLPAQWIGKLLYFKFAAFNLTGGQQNDLSQCTAYPYTPAGVANNAGFGSSNPTTVISQTTATNINTLAFAVTFTDGKVASYNLRNFTIPDPGSTPVTYYVTIYDPDRIGDSSGTLTAYCDTTPTRAYETGYVFAGKIIATHAGGNTGSVVGPSGITQTLATVG